MNGSVRPRKASGSGRRNGFERPTRKGVDLLGVASSRGRRRPHPDQRPDDPLPAPPVLHGATSRQLFRELREGAGSGSCGGVPGLARPRPDRRDRGMRLGGGAGVGTRRSEGAGASAGVATSAILAGGPAGRQLRRGRIGFSQSSAPPFRPAAPGSAKMPGRARGGSMRARGPVCSSSSRDSSVLIVR